jgi:hypothetical protein
LESPAPSVDTSRGSADVSAKEVNALKALGLSGDGMKKVVEDFEKVLEERDR